MFDNSLLYKDLINIKLKDRIAKYDLVDLIKRNSAYQLMPENANKVLRFELMANYIVSIEGKKSTHKIARSNFRNIYNSELQNIKMSEDPFEQMYTNSIIFYGGNYVVLPGINENGTLVLQNILNGIFLSEHTKGFEEFYMKAYGLTKFLLSVSNRICERAGLFHGLKSAVKSADIEFPNNSKEEVLIDAITFTHEEIDALRIECNLDLKLLESICVYLGDATIENFSTSHNDLHVKVFLKEENLFIVNLPSSIIGTLRHLIICLAYEYQFEKYLSDFFSDSLWGEVHKSTQIMNWHYDANALESIEDHDRIKDGLFQIDVDKYAYVMMFADDFSQYDMYKPYSNVSSFDITTIDERIAAVEKSAWVQKNKNESELINIVLIQQGGRGVGIAFNNYIFNGLGLKMTVEDFVIFAHLEAGNSLALYKYAKVYNDQKIFNLSFLDAYSVFVENDYSFYVSDNTKEASIFIPNGECRSLVEKYYETLNPHGVELPNRQGIIEVINIYNDIKIPIYSSIYNMNMLGNLFVKYQYSGIWITTTSERKEAFRFVDAVAYWLWQFEALIKEKLEKVIEIEIKFEDIREENDNDNSPNKSSVLCEITLSKDKLNVIIAEKFSDLLLGRDNEGERILIETLLRKICTLIEFPIIEKDFLNYLNSIAPLGPKKKIIHLNSDTSNVLLLEEGDFPPINFIESIEENILLDELGKDVYKSGNFEIGIIQEDNTILNTAVGILYNKFKDIIEELANPYEALKVTMLEYEGLLRIKEEKRLTLITYVHCFSNKNRHLIEMEKDMEHINKLSVSLRFLIEYLGTCSGYIKGEKPFSRASRDKLLAIVAQMIQMANYSDIIQYNLSDIKVSMLPSHRIGFGNRKHYQTANAKFLSENILESFDSIERHYNTSVWKEESIKEPTELDEELLLAFESEFGVSIKSYFSILGALVSIGMDINKEVKIIWNTNLINLLKKECSLEEDEIHAVLKLLVMDQRKDFLNVPKPYSKENAYPWKFNRDLSYLRKPLTRQGDYIIWTNRHLYTTSYHLINMCRGGRLKARSKEMKEFVSKHQQQNGKDFNDAVSELFSKKDLVVDTQVKKIGKKKISDDKGLDLGDIDVLVINPQKKVIVLVECKDLSIARNAYEVHYEMVGLYESKDKKRSIIERHSRRQDWVAANINSVLEKYNLNRKGKWKIKSLVVISEAMMSPHLYTKKQKVKVLPYLKLKEEIKEDKFFRK